MPNNPRSDFLRVAMGFREISVPFLEMCIEGDLAEELDLSEVELLPDAFLESNSLAETVSELLFRAPYKEKEASAYLYLMMIPTTDGLEVLTPTIERCQQEAMIRYQDEESGAFPLVVPVVVSLGDRPIPGLGRSR